MLTLLPTNSRLGMLHFTPELLVSMLLRDMRLFLFALNRFDSIFFLHYESSS